MIKTNRQRYSNSFQLHLFAIALVSVVLLFQLAGPDLAQILRYERTGIFAGQVWRMFSAHLVHLGWAHFSLNIVAFIMIWLLFWREWQQRIWFLMFVFISLGTSLGLLIFQPGLDWSVGLSGVLHGLVAAGAIGALHRGHKPALIILAVLVVKLIWERVGTMPSSEVWIGGTVITPAHLYGAITGTIIALIILRLNKIRLS